MAKHNLNENFWVGRIMRQFTFIASSMRKVLTHLVFLWCCICSTITGQQPIAGSSGKKRERKAIYWLKMWTILSSQIIKVEWSCNCCLRKIISTRAAHKRPQYLIYWVFGLYNRNKRHLPWTIHLFGYKHEGRNGCLPFGGGTRWFPLLTLCRTWAGGLLHHSLPLLSSFL